MGLDMYLLERHFAAPPYEDGADHFNGDLYNAVVNALPLPPPDTVHLPSVEISVQVAYWRKSNQVHRWFVENVQGGTDDCGTYYVDPGQLETLRDLCKQALDNRDPSLLPPQGGFFFGSTDIDEWYWKDLESTVEQLNEVLAREEGGDFYYESSW